MKANEIVAGTLIPVDFQVERIEQSSAGAISAMMASPLRRSAPLSRTMVAHHTGVGGPMDPARSSAHRTIALVGGPGSGKTTLLEAHAVRAGAISRRGAVEQGTTIGDHDPRGDRPTERRSPSRSPASRGPMAARSARSPSSTPRVTRTSSAAWTRRWRWQTRRHRRERRGRRDRRYARGMGGGRTGRCAAHRRRDPGGPRSRRLPPRARGPAGGASASASGRWSFRSARSRRSTRSPTSSASAHWSTTRTVVITTSSCRPRPRTRSTRCTGR